MTPDSTPRARARPRPRDPRWLSAAAWVVIAVFGAILLWIAFALHPVGDYYTESDFYGGYASGARAIQHGIVDPSRYPVVGPGYEFALALFGLGGSDLFTVGKLLSVACAVGTLALWFVLLRRRAGAAPAFWVTALFAANPVFVRYGYSATTDMLGTFLASASVFLLLGTPCDGRATGRGRGAVREPNAPPPASAGRNASRFAAGAVAALATLTRYNLGALLPAAIACLVWLEPPAAGRGRAVLSYLAGFALVALPWTAYSLVIGNVPGINLYRNFGFYLNPDASRNVQDEYGFLANATLRSETLLDLLRARPLELLRRSLVNVPLHLWRDAHELLGVPAAILCVAGAALALGRSLRRALAPVWAQGALLFLALLPVFYSDRYSMPLGPVYLTFAAAVAAADAGALRGVPAWLRHAVLGGGVVAVIAWCVPYQRNALVLSPVETREAGRALAGVAHPGERIVSRKGHIGYYSGLTVVPFPRFKSLGELAEFARQHGAGYLYFSWYEALLRQEFAYLLDTTAVIPGLTVVHVTTHNPSTVYRIGPAFGHDPDWLSDPGALALHKARAMVQVLPDSLAWTYRLVLAADALAERKPEDALREAEWAARARPADGLAWTLQGEALRQMHRLADARTAFERALALEPQDVEARVGLGWTQLAGGDSSAAAETWRPAIGRTENTDALGLMSALYARRGETAAAESARAALRALGH